MHISVRHKRYLHPLVKSWLDVSCILMKSFLTNGYRGNLSISQKLFSWKIVQPFGDRSLCFALRLGILMLIVRGIWYVFLILSSSLCVNPLVTSFASNPWYDQLLPQSPFNVAFFSILLELIFLNEGHLTLLSLWQFVELLECFLVEHLKNFNLTRMFSQSRRTLSWYFLHFCTWDIGDFSKRKGPKEMKEGPPYMSTYLLSPYPYLLQEKKEQRRKYKKQKRSQEIT